MPPKLTEKEVHQHIFKMGMEALTDQESECVEVCVPVEPGSDEPAFELWRLIKYQTEDKIRTIHRSLRFGEFIGSKIKLRTDTTMPMELDLLGTYDDGLFILELKVDKSAERNAFSELFAYSNYLAEMFALSGQKDVTNVLVANLDAKITKNAFLYDLLIAQRNVVVYRPVFVDNAVASLRLELYLPSDDDFKQFTNELLSHEAMECVVVSFDDVPGWIDSEEDDGALKNHTVDYLEAISCFSAQLMESEGLHGFCFMRKPWLEIPLYYRNSLIVCAVNPFHNINGDLAAGILKQLNEDGTSALREAPRSAFTGRLIRLARRALDATLRNGYSSEFSCPLWSEMVTSFVEVVFTHNLGFHPTGLLRDAYVSHINAKYAGESGEDLSMLKIDEVTDWLKAWSFMEGCGLTDQATYDDEVNDDE